MKGILKVTKNDMFYLEKIWEVSYCKLLSEKAEYKLYDLIYHDLNHMKWMVLNGDNTWNLYM